MESLASQGHSVSVYSPGAVIRVYFYAPAAGTYTRAILVRSGTSGSPSSYWPGGYHFSIDSVSPVTLTGDPSTISALDPAGEGAYWGGPCRLASA